MKWILGIVFAILYGLVTLFGLGPVFFADGPTGERMFTLLIVIVIYIILTVILRRLMKR